MLVCWPNKSFTPTNYFFKVPIIGRFIPLVSMIRRPVESCPVGTPTLNQRWFLVEFANWINVDSTDQRWSNVDSTLNLQVESTLMKQCCINVDNVESTLHQCCISINVDSTQPHDIESTLFQCWFNVLCPLGGLTKIDSQPGW